VRYPAHPRTHDMLLIRVHISQSLSFLFLHLLPLQIRRHYTAISNGRCGRARSCRARCSHGSSRTTS
jgi:hypothetical protein